MPSGQNNIDNNSCDQFIFTLDMIDDNGEASGETMSIIYRSIMKQIWDSTWRIFKKKRIKESGNQPNYIYILWL